MAPGQEPTCRFTAPPLDPADDADLQVGDESRDAGVGVLAARADVVEAAVVADADDEMLQGPATASRRSLERWAILTGQVVLRM